jgi:6-phosphogluconolactonase
MQVTVTADAGTAAVEAASWLAGQLRNAVHRRGAAVLAVSGGRTPATMFGALGEMDVPWARVTVFQVDERVAPDGDSARNSALLELLPVAAAQRKAMPVTSRNLAAAAERYAASLPDRFDVVHLGLGDDGHTASWPPNDPVVDSTDPVALCGEYRGHVRMTLTPVVVNAARHRLVLATGADKADPVQRWLLGDRSLPVQYVHRTDTVLMLDQAAAARLPSPSR